MKRLALLAVLLCLPTAPVAHAETSPESVVQAYLRTLSIDGLAGVGAYFDRESLLGIKELLLPILEAEAAEDRADVRALMFGSDASLDDVRNMQPGVFYNGFMRFLQSQMEQFRVKISGGSVIGAVYETPDLVHVVARISVGTGESAISSVDVVSLARNGDDWTIGLKSDVTAMAQAIRGQLMKAEPQSP